MDNEPIVLSKDELKDLMKETVRETLTGVGLDMEHPLEVQQDIAFLHELRHTTESIKGKAILASVGVVVVGFIGVAWLGIKAVLKP